MTYNVALLEYNQETNTFSKLTTGMKDFELCHYFVGAEIETQCRGTNSEIGGFIEASDHYGWRPLYTVAARAEPGGRVDESFRDQFMADLKKAIHGQALDGILIAFHGAMCTQLHDDAQIDLLQVLRAELGTAIPIAATFDLHANCAPAMSDWLNIAVSFRTYPHVDMALCGRKAADLLQRAMQGEIDPAIVIHQPPLLNGCNDGRTTHACAMTEVLAIADAVQDQPGILSTSINAGFFDADILTTGPSAVVCYDRKAIDFDAADGFARQLSDEIWQRRDDFDHRYGVDDLADIIAQHQQNADRQQPLVIADFSDNPGCGAYSDATTVLSALLQLAVKRAAFGALCDPQAVQVLIAAGVGSTVELTIGGKIDPNVGGGPIRVKGVVKTISDGNMVFEGPMFRGLPASLGPSVCFTVDGIDILLSSERQQMLDQNLFRAVGIEPADYDLVVVKSQQHFKAAFGPIAARIVEVDADGLSSADLFTRDFQKVRRPIYPLDQF